MTQSNNPLQQYFRQPAIYLRLPSQGQHWATASIVIPDIGELPVLPMTAIDEITYRTPDALFNGQAVVNVIQSCIPNIKDAWECPSSDINSILTAIRIASYGHEMEIGTTCPHCEHAAEYGLDLRSVLDQIKSPDYSKTITHGDLEVAFKPMAYRDQNKINSLNFEEQRILQSLPATEVTPEEKLRLLNEVMKKITELTIETIKWSITNIRTPTAIVTQQEHIHEFLCNCDRKVFTTIRDHIVALRTQSELTPLNLKCEECAKEYTQPLTLDMSSFFAAAS